MKTIQTILHPTDLSESSKPALGLAVQLAQDHGARLIVLHVTAPPVAWGAVGMTIPVAQMPKEVLEADRIKLEGLTVGSGADCRVVEGVATVESDTGCDLIVLGTHGRTGLDRLLMGSVAEAVIHRAGCMVLAVKVPVQLPTAPVSPQQGQDA